MDLETVVNSLAPRLLRYSLGHTGNRAVAEEVAQDALTALVGRWRDYGPPESPEAWVFTVARRRAQRRRIRNRLLQPLSALLGPNTETSLSETLDDRREDPEQRAAQRSELRYTLNVLARLRPGDREVLLLTAAGEMSIDNAASSLGISASAFKMRLHRARQRLERLLKNTTSPKRPSPLDHSKSLLEEPSSTSSPIGHQHTPESHR